MSSDNTRQSANDRPTTGAAGGAVVVANTAPNDDPAVIEVMRQLSHSYPIHWLVWHNSDHRLEQLLNSHHKVFISVVNRWTLALMTTHFACYDNQLDVELRDPRGRTPLMLAVTLGHYRAARHLLRHNANVNIEDSLGFNGNFVSNLIEFNGYLLNLFIISLFNVLFTFYAFNTLLVLHEAVSSNDPEFIREVLERRDWQRYTSRVDGIPVLLKKICDTPDFYVEMKWEFTSWVPLVTRMCPSDTYKIYKSRSSVRIDTTLVGFDQTSNWQRGNRSYIFTGTENGAVFMEVDHDNKQVIVETMKMMSADNEDAIEMLTPSDELVNARLTTPTSTTFIDTDKIHFERSKAGIYGFRTDKSETINGHDSKVFCAQNVEVVTKTRTEHLSAEDKERHNSAAANRLAPLQSLLGMTEIEDKAPTPPPLDSDAGIDQTVDQRNRFNITAVQ
ncbi:unnamed protein product, partial [Medioppia subpectinata]